VDPRAGLLPYKRNFNYEFASMFTLMYILLHRLQKCIHLTLKLKPSFLLPLISSPKIIDAFVSNLFFWGGGAEEGVKVKI
jgi:hypothetical protein